MTRPAVRPLPPSTGNAGAIAPPQQSLVGELAHVLQLVHDHYVDVDVGFASLEERALLDRAAAVLERARRQGSRP